MCLRCVLQAGGCGPVVCSDVNAMCSMDVLRAGRYVPAVCSVGRWWSGCSVLYEYSTGWQLCAGGVFYGLAVVCRRCVLRAGDCVPAIVLRAGGCGPVGYFTGRQWCEFSVFYGQAIMCLPAVCSTGRRLCACHWLASLGVWGIVITWILIYSQWVHGCGVTSLKMLAGLFYISASVIGTWGNGIRQVHL